MRRHSVMWICAALLGCGTPDDDALAYYQPAPVSVEIVDERGRRFDAYPLTESRDDTFRAYVKARRGASYRIRVSNRSGERVGVVLAVDGRNIISGARSDLKPRESMYVLEPWETNEYRGWRTSIDEVHEFFFTEWPNSYAERTFGDRSAQGVIAMAVFRDRDWQRQIEEQRLRDEASSRESERRAHAPDKSVAGAAAAPPGTGFGERRYEPARRVEFQAENSPLSRSFLKYEWPDTLCRKGIACDDWDGPQPRRRNRFWPDGNGGFAPYPARPLR